VEKLKQTILKGQYKEAVQCCNDIVTDQPIRERIQYMLYEGQYKEFMQLGGQYNVDAVQILQHELVPRTKDRKKLH
jgi:hypothetical protein